MVHNVRTAVATASRAGKDVLGIFALLLLATSKVLSWTEVSPWSHGQD